MHKLCSTTPRPGFVVHVIRVVTFGAALVAVTGIAIADVIAAEAEEPAALALVAEDAPIVEPRADERAPTLLAVVVPDAPAVEPAAPEPPEPPKKKKRAGKLKFGRFEGY